MSKEYSVRWEIDIDADSPEDAARQALDIQRNSQSTATFFDVFHFQIEHGKSLENHFAVDLTEGTCERVTE